MLTVYMLAKNYSLLFTLRVSFDFLRILRRFRCGTLRIGKKVILWVFNVREEN